SHSRWLTAAAGVGITYFVVGFVFGALAGEAASTAGRTGWRRAAWVISAAVFLAHVAHERMRRRNHAASSALHAAAAAAIGGFLLAIAATIHKAALDGIDARYLLALVAWPLVTGLPAFVAALALCAVLRPRPSTR